MDADNMEKQRVLIVEDDRPLAAGLCRALQNEKTETVSCHTLQEAEKLLGGVKPDAEPGGQGGKTEPDTRPDFDLVVLDVNLPDGNGFDFLQKMKRKYDICIVMLTANDMETDIVAGLELGADDYITKPFSLAVLRARVATQLRRVEARERNGSLAVVESIVGTDAGHMVAHNAENGMTADALVQGFISGADALSHGEGWITDGDYRFHFAKMLFYHGQEQIELSKSEQKLLRILVENRGITLTREQLFERIWSVDAEFVDENTLSVTVKRLRDKLGAQDRIRTVYGIGYRWE